MSNTRFFNYLTGTMKKFGMPKYNMDSCLFWCEHVIHICYFEDLVFWSQNEEYIHEFDINSGATVADLYQYVDSAGFLGVILGHDEVTRLLEINPTGIIYQVIETLGLDIGNSKGKLTLV